METATKISTQFSLRKDISCPSTTELRGKQFCTQVSGRLGLWHCPFGIVPKTAAWSLIECLFWSPSPVSVMTRVLAARRAEARACLDSAPDFVVAGGNVEFRHTFEAVEDSESFCRTPEDVVDAARRLLTLDAADGISAAVHDTVVVRIGANRVPFFAMVNGWRGRCLLPLAQAVDDV